MRIVAAALLLTAAPLAAADDPIDAFVHAEMARQKETVFQSGSVGKQFTAALVMRLIEDGRLALDDPLTKFFPDAPPAWQAIHVRHLLTHTSGLPDYVEGMIDLRKDYSEDEMLRFAYALKLEFAPGARWNYSNTGYALLGFLVHRVTGRFYGDLLAERIFTPLGMKTARVISEADIVANRAAGYRLVGGVLKNQEWVAPQLNTTADGSLYLSLVDYVAWDRGLRAGAVLSSDGWRQVFTPVSLNSGKTYPYGFGWDVEERAGARLLRHGGSWQGFKTDIARFLGSDLTIVVLANLAEAEPERFTEGIAGLVDPRLQKPELKPIADPDPKVADRVRALLASAAQGSLTSEELAYVRQGFFPETASEIQRRLAGLGAPTKLTLLERVVRGDDQVSTYDVAYERQTFRVVVALAPDGKVGRLSLSPR
jgi:CubicO group peptidase (beta-lactamase class C family)